MGSGLVLEQGGHNQTARLSVGSEHLPGWPVPAGFEVGAGGQGLMVQGDLPPADVPPACRSGEVGELVGAEEVDVYRQRIDPGVGAGVLLVQIDDDCELGTGSGYTGSFAQSSRRVRVIVEALDAEHMAHRAC